MFEKIQHSTISRLDSISAEQFLKEYKTPSKPVVLTELSSDWPARKKWSFDYLSKVAGDCEVPVYSSNKATGKQHQHAAERVIALRDYLELLKGGESDLRMFFYEIFKHAPKLLNDFEYPSIGLKLFKRLPVLFMGGRGAKVQMHYDIDLADLLLCHFGGKKHVLLVPPEQTKYLYKVPYSFSALFDVDLTKPDFDRFPALQNVQAQITELQHGDVLYIPSGYWHYIIYEEAGFSMTLRALPRDFKTRMTLLKNIFITRSIEGLMRKLIGQKWNDRNERRAIEITNKNLITQTHD